MQLFRCGHNLTNTMSPQNVGLITMCLVAFSQAITGIATLTFELEDPSRQAHAQNAVNPKTQYYQTSSRQGEKAYSLIHETRDAQNIRNRIFGNKFYYKNSNEKVENETLATSESRKQVLVLPLSVKTNNSVSETSHMKLTENIRSYADIALSENELIAMKNLSNVQSTEQEFPRGKNYNIPLVILRRNAHRRSKSLYDSNSTEITPSLVQDLSETDESIPVKNKTYEELESNWHELSYRGLVRLSGDDSSLKYTGEGDGLLDSLVPQPTSQPMSGDNVTHDDVFSIMSSTVLSPSKVDALKTIHRLKQCIDCNNEQQNENTYDASNDGILQSTIPFTESVTSVNNNEELVSVEETATKNVYEDLSTISYTTTASNSYSTVRSEELQLPTERMRVTKFQEVLLFSQKMKDLQAKNLLNDLTSGKNEFANEAVNSDEDLVNRLNYTVSTTEDQARRPKMSNRANSNNNPNDVQNLNSKDYDDYEYDRELPDHFTNMAYSVPEFQPGAFLPYLEPFRRRAVHDIEKKETTSRSVIARTFTDSHTAKTTDFKKGSHALNSTREQHESAIGSTFYPFRLEDKSLQFTRKEQKTTLPMETTESKMGGLESHNDKDDDEEEVEQEEDDYMDIREGSLTMETLAYFLIGTCCGLSILCLCIVVAAIKCRRSLVHRRIRKQFRSKLCYPHSNPKSLTSAWRHHYLDYVMPRHSNKHSDSSFSSSNTYNCRCVTWSLGARNLDTQPICPTRSSVYLCGRKRLPFGAASTLQYESMLGRRRQASMSVCRPPPPPPPKPESSNENDSLDDDSVTDPLESTCPKQCTCIKSPWRTQRPQTAYTHSACSAGRHSSTRNCNRGSSEMGIELRHINRNCPPPVSGMNYLDRADGVVYWSSNEERLI